MRERQLQWDGCINVRDLGGLPAVDGRTTRWGAVVRGDHPSRLSAAGWRAVLAHGVRTVIELYTLGAEVEHTDAAPRPAALTTVRLAIEDATDADFTARWVATKLWCTPLYYRDALTRWPQRHARVVEAFAHAPPGGVLVHCGRGHDRTGVISLLLLALAGVSPEHIASDYALSDRHMPERERAALREALASAKTTSREVIVRVVDELDLDAYLRDGGLDRASLELARSRLTGRRAPARWSP